MADLESGERQGLLAVEWEAIERHGPVKWGKAKFNAFKVSGLGIFLLARWLPLQDVGSDVLVTFCKESFLLCSDQGLYWDTRNPWWARFSVLFMVLPYVLLWALAFPLVVRDRRFKGVVPAPVLVALWGVFGLPTTVLLDATSILFFPCWPPKQAILLNMMRLRLILEACVESPTQTGLQIRIFYVKVTSSDRHLHQDFEMPWTLLFSICTSLATLVLALLDINDTAKEQKISFRGALVDTLCVGLGWRAPLLHTLKLQSEVDFGDEGELTVEHCFQIAQAAKASGTLRCMKFGAANKLTREGAKQLWRIFYEERARVAAMEWQLAGKLYVLHHGGRSLTDDGLRELASSLPEQLTGGLYLNFEDNQNFTDDGLRELAASLPKQLAGDLRLNFSHNKNFTDGGLRELAASLPKQLTGSLHLNFWSNEKFTDEGLRALATSLPKQLAGDLRLVFKHNKNFTDGGLQELAASLPKQLAGSLHLSFWGNKNFTDEGLRELAASLPKQLARSLHLDFSDNKNFTDEGLRELAASLPEQLADDGLDLNFERTGFIIDLEEFRRRYRA